MMNRETDNIELSISDIKKIYYFGLSRISLLCLSANPQSATFRKAATVVKAIENGNPTKAMIKFINYYNKLKHKP